MQFGHTLRERMDRPPHYSPGLLSRLSGVPKATIVNWLEGRVSRPRRWQDIARVADAMRLDRDQTELLLAAAGHLPLAQLALRADGGDRALLFAWTPASGSALGRATPLPTLATPFVGREAERGTLAALVSDPDVRVVTLTGVAGVGKTRLAIEVASAVASKFDEGVAYAALAPLTDPAMVADFVAQALGVTGQSASIASAVASRHQLVVLDNFEHLLPALPVITDLIAGAPGLTVLVTSRAVLHIYGEYRFEVAPLHVPDVDEEEFESVATSSAVTLFVQRARAVDPSFRLRTDNIGAVVEVCRRLDGLPLAIELAAARTTVLEPEGLLRRLADSFGLLNWGARDLPARHQSLEATLQWSLSQLDDDAQRLFARLSVFMSGWRLDGAEAVGPPLESAEVLDALTKLVENSLVRSVPVRNETRFVMLETVRGYAASLLSDDESRLAHELAVRYVVDVASAVEREARGPQQGTWFDRADEELDNMRALLGWSFQNDDSTSGAIIAASLLPFWVRRRALLEGQRWLDLALASAGQLSPKLRATTLYAAGWVARQRGDIVTAEHRLRESLGMFVELGDETARAGVLGSLGVVASDRGDLDESASFQRASLDICRPNADAAGTAAALANLGNVEHRRGRLREAVALQEEGASLFAEIGDAIGEATILTNIAAVYRDLGLLHEAQEALVAAIGLWKQAAERSELVACLELLVGIIADRQRPAGAVRLAAAAAAVRQTSTTDPAPAYTTAHHQLVERLEQTLGPTLFEEAWQEGWAMNVDQVVALTDN